MIEGVASRRFTQICSLFWSFITLATAPAAKVSRASARPTSILAADFRVTLATPCSRYHMAQDSPSNPYIPRSAPTQIFAITPTLGSV